MSEIVRTRNERAPGVDRRAVDRLRAICLALPGASEKEAWGDPTWRIGDRMFAVAKFGDGRTSAWMKAGPGVQELLIEANPKRFFRPPYVGHKGWIGIRLDDGDVDWDEVALHVEESYALVAPKRRRQRVERASGH